METKNLQQALEYIQERPDTWYLDIAVEGNREQYNIPLSTDLVDISEFIQDVHQKYPSSLIEMILKAPNGTDQYDNPKYARSYRHCFLVDLEGGNLQPTSKPPQTVKNHLQNDEIMNENHLNTTSTQLQPTSNPPPTLNIQQPNLGGLEGFLINDLRDKNKELKVENKELKSENKQLEKTNFDLEKRIELQEKDFEIQRMAEESEAKGGLNGFIDKAVENDKMMDALGMILSKLTNGQQQNSNETATISQQNGNNTEIRQNVDGWLASITPERATNIYQLFTVIASTENLEEELLNQLDDATETQN